MIYAFLIVLWLDLCYLFYRGLLLKIHQTETVTHVTLCYLNDKREMHLFQITGHDL